MPHVPQLAGSLSTLMHVVPHSMFGDMQNGTHAPPVHTSPAGHAFPHAPQFVASVCRSTQALPHVTIGAVHAI